MPYPLPAMSRPESPSPQLKVVFDLFDALESCDIRGVDNALSNTSFKRAFLPKSLDCEPMNKAQTLKDLEENMFRVLKGLKMTYFDIVESRNRIVIHSKAAPGLVSVSGQSYSNEYMFLIAVAEEGGQWKITRVEQFMDSRFIPGFWAEEVNRGSVPVIPPFAHAPGSGSPQKEG